MVNLLPQFLIAIHRHQHLAIPGTDVRDDKVNPHSSISTKIATDGSALSLIVSKSLVGTT